MTKTDASVEVISASDNLQLQRDFNPWVVYVVCLLVSLVFMFFYGINSPIYTFNAHCDYQWYLTMGRGMLSGKIPYRDLFDHKGPLIYTLFAFACLFPDPQFVIWCIEVFCISLFLFYCYRIARKFLSPWLSLLVVPLMMMILSTNYANGTNGASVEEYCLPIFAYGLLCFLDFIMDRRAPSWRRSLALGIYLSILFWTKYSMLEFFIVPMLIWLFINLKERSFLRIVQQGLIMLGGFLLVTLPVVICFAVLGALDDLYQVYFVVNMGNYTGYYIVDNGYETSDPWFKFKLSFTIGFYYIVALIWGLICFTIHNWKRKGSGVLLLITVLSSWLMVGFTGGFKHYYLPLYIYALLGVIYTIKPIVFFFKQLGVLIKHRTINIVLFLLVIGLSFGAAWPLVFSTGEINAPRDNYCQLVVADMINEYNQTNEQAATLFCYKIGDFGFYNAANIIPDMRYYALSNFTEEELPEMHEAFENAIREQAYDFVVIYPDTYNKEKNFLETYYHPYINNDLEASTLISRFYDWLGCAEVEFTILFRN